MKEKIADILGQIKLGVKSEKPLERNLVIFIVLNIVTIVFLGLAYGIYCFGINHARNHAIEQNQMVLANINSEEVVTKNLYVPKSETAEIEKEHGVIIKTALDFRAKPLAHEDSSKSKIVVIINDLGLSKSYTLDALELPSNITLGFSPYASSLAEWADQANAKGFEILVGLPMQPTDYPVNDPGPHALLHNLAVGENLSRLDWVLARSDKFAGIYSYPNESFSSYRTNILPVLDELKNKDFFLIYGNKQNEPQLNSLSESTGLELKTVNVLLDEEPSEEKLKEGFLKLEGAAYNNGYAIGYLNAYPISIKVLKEWLATIDSSKLAVVPASNLFAYRSPESSEQIPYLAQKIKDAHSMVAESEASEKASGHGEAEAKPAEGSHH
jgi:polysaccharide deacetylase 2 family uncharacterized protein YibQ